MSDGNAGGDFTMGCLLLLGLSFASVAIGMLCGTAWGIAAAAAWCLLISVMLGVKETRERGDRDGGEKDGREGRRLH